MRLTETTSSREALDELVHQFADPLSCLRELIQNSVDAGTSEIEVEVTFRTDSRGGLAELRVQDWGAGMDRRIIDTRLTRLFASDKTHDMTKIGKFGIGFVSVFALEPEAVCVDTGRAGEAWRILFEQDRSFRRIALDDAVEGTCVRIFKRCGEADFEQLRAAVTKTLRRWCRFLPVPLRVGGEAINQDLRAVPDALVSASHEEEGTIIVAAVRRDYDTFLGFYNRGLTLLEADRSDWPGVHARISSRWLEHTLTRDNVIRDDNYQRAMKRLEQLIEGPLTEALRDRIEQALRQHEPAEVVTPLQRAVVHRFHKSSVPKGWRGVPVARARGDRLVTPRDLQVAARDKKLATVGAAERLADALVKQGWIVLDDTSAHQNLITLAEARVGCIHLDAELILPLPLRSGAERRLQAPLREATAALLAAFGAKLTGVTFAHLNYPGSPVADRVAITAANPAQPTPTREALTLATGFFDAKRALVVNADHPSVVQLEQLAEREPELAAWTLIKLFILVGSLDPAVDSKLGALAMEARCRRLPR